RDRSARDLEDGLAHLQAYGEPVEDRSSHLLEVRGDRLLDDGLQAWRRDDNVRPALDEGGDDCSKRGRLQRLLDLARKGRAGERDHRERCKDDAGCIDSQENLLVLDGYDRRKGNGAVYLYVVLAGDRDGLRNVNLRLEKGVEGIVDG